MYSKGTQWFRLGIKSQSKELESHSYPWTTKEGGKLLQTEVTFCKRRAERAWKKVRDYERGGDDSRIL